MKFINDQFYSKYSELVCEHALRDSHGEEYKAAAPPGYKILGFFNRGGQCFVTEVMHKKTRAHRILKNYIENAYEFPRWTWQKVIEVQALRLSGLRHGVAKDGVSVPKIYEAGISGRHNYIIEEKMYGVRMTEEVLDSLGKRRRQEAFDKIGRFLCAAHTAERDCPVFSVPQTGIERWESLAPLKKLPEKYKRDSIVHGDFLPKNVLLNECADGELEISVVDWAGAIRSDASHEFARMAQLCEALGNSDPNVYDSEYYKPKTIEKIVAAYVHAATLKSQ